MLMRGQLELARASKTRKMWMATTRTPAVLQQAAQQAQIRRLSRGLRTLVVHAQSTSTQTQQQQQTAALSSANGYKLPPKEIVDIVDKPSQPALSFSPDRKMILQLNRPPANPPIYEIARPEIKLAGMRIDAEQFSRSKMSYYIDMAIVSAEEIVPAPPEKCRHIEGFPAGSWINNVSWSPDGDKITFTTRSAGGPGDPPRGPLQLWVADVATGKARCVLSGPQYGLNTIFEDYGWLDNDTVVASVVPQGHGPPPQRPPVPPGPRIQDNSAGKKAQNRTFPDLLKDEFDAQLFDYYCSSELVQVHLPSGSVTPVGPARVYTEVSPSPDGRYLLVGWLERPYSYTVPCGRFPKRIQLWERSGALVREMAALPLAEDIPIAFNSTRKGPRGITWREDKDAEICWIEAQDGGDAAVEVSPRDIVYLLPADAAHNGTTPTVLATTDLRCGGVAWCDDDLALVFESWHKTRRSVWHLVAPARPQDGLKVLFDRNYEDVYGDPGTPVTRRTSRGTFILAKVDGKRQFLMQGSGASPQGNKPFLDLLDLDTKESSRLWQSSEGFYENTGSLMSDTGDQPISLANLSLTFSRETAMEPPQTFIKTWGPDGQVSERQLTNFPHPHPQLKDMSKEIIRYDRADGVTMTATLYLPPGYDKERDGPLPCILWAYPREFKSKEAAGQMRRSPHQFAGVGGTAPTLWLTRGYAVLDGPTFPIIAEGEGAEPNDTHLEQLTASARAALEEVQRRGVVDPKRVSVGGHSYGAFMAANLLAHAPELFAAGIARSGAYNRTLTPFGFQNEERTYWQAPDVYNKMSPFMNVDKISRPLLLIHGEDDDNTGTFPLQSERLYQALKGHGATTRLVLLPHEGHGYRARESVLHTLYEMDQWIEKHAGYGRTDPEYFSGEEE